MPNHDEKASDAARPEPKRRVSRWLRLLQVSLVLVALLVIARAALPGWVRQYVNDVIDKDPRYDGTVGQIEMKLHAGGYTIHDVRLNKTTGNVPVPFFSATRIDLFLESQALMSGKLVGRIEMVDPQINFVDSDDASTAQTGGGGPWLQILRDLFPFRINSVVVKNGSLHFRAFDSKPPVDVYLSKLEGEVSNLTNIHDEVKPLVTTVEAKALAMDQAKFELNMKVNPFSYRPTFELACRLVGLDVTQTNTLARNYGQFDFERGRFDLVIELTAREGQVEGYVKPLFRHLRVLSLKKDLREDNALEFFWEALVGVSMELLKNQRRDQVATLIPLEGEIDGPNTDVLTVVGNVLRNAFIRAYLPRFEGTAPDVDTLRFKPGSVTEPLPTLTGE